MLTRFERQVEDRQSEHHFGEVVGRLGEVAREERRGGVMVGVILPERVDRHESAVLLVDGEVVVVVLGPLHRLVELAVELANAEVGAIGRAVEEEFGAATVGVLVGLGLLAFRSGFLPRRAGAALSVGGPAVLGIGQLLALLRGVPFQTGKRFHFGELAVLAGSSQRSSHSSTHRFGSGGRRGSVGGFVEQLQLLLLHQPLHRHRLSSRLLQSERVFHIERPLLHRRIEAVDEVVDVRREQ